VKPKDEPNSYALVGLFDKIARDDRPRGALLAGNARLSAAPNNVIADDVIPMDVDSMDGQKRWLEVTLPVRGPASVPGEYLAAHLNRRNAP
jgi:hypothetical protein